MRRGVGLLAVSFASASPSWSAGYDVDLYVFLGTDRPTSAQVAAVDAELARLRT